MSLPYANVPQVLTRWSQAREKAVSAGLLLWTDQVELRLSYNSQVWFASDDLEVIITAIDAFVAAQEALQA